jgi:hypothetical protein
LYLIRQAIYYFIIKSSKHLEQMLKYTMRIGKGGKQKKPPKNMGGFSALLICLLLLFYNTPQ